MIVDVHSLLSDYKGHQIVDGNGAPFNMGDALIAAANNGGTQEEPNKTKLLRFRLAMRIAAAMETADGNISLTAEEVVLLKNGVAKLYAPLVYGRVVELIDPDAEE